MDWPASQILKVLDGCCASHSFPALNHSEVFPAATRMFLFRSEEDWAITIEVFGFSPRADVPAVTVVTVGSRLVNRPGPEDFFNDHAFRCHRDLHPHDETRFVYPVENGPWLEGESVSQAAEEVVVRGAFIPLPQRSEYEGAGITLGEPENVQVHELCRYLGERHRDLVLCTPQELAVNLRPEMKLLLKLDEWHHPDVAAGGLPGGSATFQQLAEVLVAGDASGYRPPEPANTP
jgi:hypothetical protein